MFWCFWAGGCLFCLEYFETKAVVCSNVKPRQRGTGACPCVSNASNFSVMEAGAQQWRCQRANNNEVGPKPTPTPVKNDENTNIVVCGGAQWRREEGSPNCSWGISATTTTQTERHFEPAPALAPLFLLRWLKPSASLPPPATTRPHCLLASIFVLRRKPETATLCKHTVWPSHKRKFWHENWIFSTHSHSFSLKSCHWTASSY